MNDRIRYNIPNQNLIRKEGKLSIFEKISTKEFLESTKEINAQTQKVQFTSKRKERKWLSRSFLHVTL
jgi:hypothetical protein